MFTQGFIDKSNVTVSTDAARNFLGFRISWAEHIGPSFTRVALKLLTPPFPNENERLIHQLEIQLF